MTSSCAYAKLSCLCESEPQDNGKDLKSVDDNYLSSVQPLENNVNIIMPQYSKASKEDFDERLNLWST